MSISVGLPPISDRLATYLENGGTIVANGHIAYPFLPRMTPFRPIPNYRVEDLIVRRHIAHPIWEGVTVEDLSRRRGVTGFTHAAGIRPRTALRLFTRSAMKRAR